MADSNSKIEANQQVEITRPGDMTSENETKPEEKDYHDIIVIGASAGGLNALQKLVHDLPADLAAAIFIVVHVSAESPGLLAEILESAGPLPACYPYDRQLIEEGQIYIAPANHHMLLEQGLIRVVRGPKENRHRPAIDPLFRSAARNYGPRVAGIILSGTLDDGSAGLRAVKQRGGLTVVQDPDDAEFDEMPRNAIKYVRKIDYIVPVSDMAALLVNITKELAAEPSDEQNYQISAKLAIEDELAMSNIPDQDILNTVGTPATIVCPECHGTLWEVKDGDLLRFRCRVGHAYTVQSLVAEHAHALESALWVALRTLEENVSLHRRLAERAQLENQLLSASSFMETALQTEQRAELIRQVLSAKKPLEEEV